MTKPWKDEKTPTKIRTIGNKYEISYSEAKIKYYEVNFFIENCPSVNVRVVNSRNSEDDGDQE